MVDVMKTKLDTVFRTKPRAGLVVKAVEPFREQSAGLAFYEPPSADGVKPGTYFVNLHNMKIMTKYQMEALVYHEGIPGHHMQIGIAMELQNVPQFQKLAEYTAYTEGWGLYSELLPKEMGFYQDPYSDFGRLVMELWRACRLVVDTGIHFYKWTRERAIQYLKETTPNSDGEIVNGVERYIVMPGQATAYKIGMRKILELRKRAQGALGERFDLREFHDVVLVHGALPLSLLEEVVNTWISGRKGN